MLATESLLSPRCCFIPRTSYSSTPSHRQGVHASSITGEFIRAVLLMPCRVTPIVKCVSLHLQIAVRQPVAPKRGSVLARCMTPQSSTSACSKSAGGTDAELTTNRRVEARRLLRNVTSLMCV
jgi:hypothetical protein